MNAQIVNVLVGAVVHLIERNNIRAFGIRHHTDMKIAIVNPAILAINENVSCSLAAIFVYANAQA